MFVSWPQGGWEIRLWIQSFSEKRKNCGSSHYITIGGKYSCWNSWPMAILDHNEENHEVDVGGRPVLWSKENLLNCICLDLWTSEHSCSYWENKWANKDTVIFWTAPPHTHTRTHTHSTVLVQWPLLLGIHNRERIKARQSRKDSNTSEGCDHRSLK